MWHDGGLWLHEFRLSADQSILAFQRGSFRIVSSPATGSGSSSREVAQAFDRLPLSDLPRRTDPN